MLQATSYKDFSKITFNNVKIKNGYNIKKIYKSTGMTLKNLSLQKIIVDLGRSSGAQFFQRIARSLSDALLCDYVFIAQVNFEYKTAQTIAVSAHNNIVPNFEYALKDTPCEVVSSREICCYPSEITRLYPKDQLLIDMKIESYIGVPLYDSKDNVLGLVVALHEKPILNKENVVTLFELFSTRVASELERIALQNFDSVTHLYSKTYIETYLKEKGDYALVIADMNSFSYINEAYGFTFGNKVLKVVAEVLKNQFTQHISAQLDADKFILLYQNISDIEKEIETIQYYFSHNTIDAEGIKMYISFSYGVAKGEDNLLRTASAALKRSKARGRNACIILNANNEEGTFSGREAFIEANNIIHNALNSNQVIPYFQGIRNNITGKIVKFEALARVEHNNKVLSPYHFLEPAKLSGMLPRITKVMISKSFAAMQNNEYTFSLNITEDDLNYNYLFDYFTQECQKYNIAPSRVILEILEGVSSGSKDEHLAQLKALKSMGFKLAIDDFGAEYSNFERILDLDVDFLKIDAKYIKNIDTNLKSLEIVKAIVGFTKSIGIACIAEYVHSVTVHKIVESLGIEYSQGYLFSRPHPLGSKKELKMLINFNELSSEILEIKIRGHYEITEEVDRTYEKLALKDKCYTKILFDSRDSDFHEQSKEDIIVVAQSDSSSPTYSNIKKVAILVNDSYSEYIGQIWCDNLRSDSPFYGRVFLEYISAKEWLENETLTS
jgi:diguanylate cyclase (GGDEF)-like protein